MEDRTVRRRVVVNGRELTPDEIAALPDDAFANPDRLFDALSGSSEPVRTTRVTAVRIDGRTGLEFSAPEWHAREDETRRGMIRTWATWLAIGFVCVSLAGTITAIHWIPGVIVLITGGVFYSMAAWAGGLQEWRVSPDALRTIDYKQRNRMGLISMLAAVLSVCLTLVIAKVVLSNWPWALARFQSQLNALTGGGSP
ncbi:MAG: hypothetical protein ACTS22_07750 [Phycisphaerales bacterium]